jgi:hypothetical protein
MSAMGISVEVESYVFGGRLVLKLSCGVISTGLLANDWREYDYDLYSTMHSPWKQLL